MPFFLLFYVKVAQLELQSGDYLCDFAGGSFDMEAAETFLYGDSVLLSALFSNWKISLNRARFLAEKIYQIDYVNPYDKKSKSVLLHAKEQPEVTELLDLIAPNCKMGVPLQKTGLFC